jgi:TrmH family RNA methyltransferase
MEQKPVIASLSNPLVKRIRGLRHRKDRAETGLFIVEGLHHVGEALEAGWDVDAILYAPDVLTSSFGSTLLATYPSGLQPVSRQVMESLADKDHPQGILALVHQRHPVLAQLTEPRRLVAVVNPQDPGNVGTILRTIDAIAADALLLVDGGVDPYHPTSVRASMGTLFSKPIVQTSFADLVMWSDAARIHRVGTSAHAPLDYRTFKPNEPWLLLLGSEQRGLSAEHLAACETAISLPMRGRASSLNLAVAAGILLYQFSA